MMLYLASCRVCNLAFQGNWKTAVNREREVRACACVCFSGAHVTRCVVSIELHVEARLAQPQIQYEKYRCMESAFSFRVFQKILRTSFPDIGYDHMTIYSPTKLKKWNLVLEMKIKILMSPLNW